MERDGDSFVVTNTLNDPGEGPEGELPATGLLWWPLPILIAAGVIFVVIGLLLRKKGDGDEDE